MKDTVLILRHLSVLYLNLYTFVQTYEAVQQLQYEVAAVSAQIDQLTELINKQFEAIQTEQLRTQCLVLYGKSAHIERHGGQNSMFQISWLRR